MGGCVERQSERDESKNLLQPAPNNKKNPTPGPNIEPLNQAQKNKVRLSIKVSDNSIDTTGDFAKISINDIKDQIIDSNLLAEGRFGKVYKAKWRNMDVAVKKMRYRGDSKIVDSFVREVTLVSNCIHPNILTFYGANTTPPHLYLVSSLAERGSLYEVIHTKKIDIDWETRLSIIGQTAAAMLYLHSRTPPIVHRDLKSPNILLGQNWTVQVADFGLSKVKEHTFVSTTSTAGSPAWMAPEVLRGEHFTHKCDVYSFAVVMWEIVTSELPWSEADYNIGQIVGMVGFQGIRPPLPQDIPECPYDICDLIEQCWDGNPNSRPDFEYIYNQLRKFCPRDTLLATDRYLVTTSKDNSVPLPQLETSNLQLGILGFDE